MKTQNCVILKSIIGPKSGTAMAVPAVPPTTALVTRVVLCYVRYYTSQ